MMIANRPAPNSKCLGHACQILWTNWYRPSAQRFGQFYKLREPHRCFSVAGL